MLISLCRVNFNSSPLFKKINNKKYCLLVQNKAFKAYFMTFWLLNGFVHRLPSAAFVDCSGIFEKAFSIVLIFPFVLKPYVARLKFHNAS